MSFYYFTSADSGAPTLNGVNGALVTVLDWILVTKGGWTKPYTGTNKAIFRAPSGNRFPLRVVHDSAISGTATAATIRCSESASGIDTVVDPVPTVALRTDATAIWTVSNTANATARDYRGVVADTFVWLFVRVGSDNQWAPYFFGDISPRFAGDAYNTAIFVTANSGAMIFYSNPSQFTGGASQMFFVRSIDGSVKSTRAGVYPSSGQSGFGQLASATGAKAYPNPYDSKLHFADIRLTCNGSTIAGTGASSQFERGWLPNIKQPLHQSSAIQSTDTFIDSAYNASATFELFSASTTAASVAAFLILEKTNTWVAP